MKISVFYENLYDGAQAAGTPAEDLLRAVRDAGAEGVYLSAESWERDRGTLRGTLEKLGMRVTGMHAHCDFPWDPDTPRYREVVDLAADSGADNLLIIPGMLSGGHTGRDIARMADGVRRTVEYGRSAGVPVLMEDFDGLLAPYNCIAGLQYFLDSVEGLGCAFDTGNFAAFHEDELAALELFAGKIGTVHLKDRSTVPQHEGNTPFVCADGSRVYACATGSGYIRLPEILRKLREGDYRGNLIVELYACDPRYFLQDALDSLGWLRKQPGVTGD